MASWDVFATSDPTLAEHGRNLMFRLGDGIGFLATVRHDHGGPRVHPVCVTPSEGWLHVCIPRSSPKHRDLLANPSYMLHAFPAEEDAEFSMRGRALLVVDLDARAKVGEAVEFATGLQDHEDVFRLDIERADSTAWEAWNTPQTRPVRRTWRAEG